VAGLQRRATERGVQARVTAVQGDLDDPGQALRAVGAALRPGGRLSLLVANRDGAVLARAVAGHPDEAAHVLTDPAGRWGEADGTARRFRLDDLLPLLAGAGLGVEQVHGVRVVADLVPGQVLDGEPGAAAALLALERTLSARPPFRDVATQLHMLAVKPAPADG
jgi:SAM-dependent methyltransferase